MNRFPCTCRVAGWWPGRALRCPQRTMGVWLRLWFRMMRKSRMNLPHLRDVAIYAAPRPAGVFCRWSVAGVPGGRLDTRPAPLETLPSAISFRSLRIFGPKQPYGWHYTLLWMGGSFRWRGIYAPLPRSGIRPGVYAGFGSPQFLTVPIRPPSRRLWRRDGGRIGRHPSCVANGPVLKDGPTTASRRRPLKRPQRESTEQPLIFV